MVEGADSGLYQMIYYLPLAKVIKIGRLGEQYFTSGYYIYTGQARRGLQARIRRHISRKKKLHWHIDYLSQHAICIAHRAYLYAEGQECALQALTAKLDGAQINHTGFGSSDCHCTSHLTYFRNWELAVQIFSIKLN